MASAVGEARWRGDAAVISRQHMRLCSAGPLGAEPWEPALGFAAELCAGPRRWRAAVRSGAKRRQLAAAIWRRLV